MRLAKIVGFLVLAIGFGSPHCIAQIQVAAGIHHSVVVESDGTVLTCGDNSFGQLGDGSTTDRWTLAPILGLPPIIQVAAGSLHTLAVDDSGNVYAWGWNVHGQAGVPPLGGTIGQVITVPTIVPGLAGVVSVAAGDLYSMALKADGTVWAWGNNGSGQLGNGQLGPLSGPGSAAPIQVSGLTSVIQIAAGSDVSAAVSSNGTIWTWGTGHLGNGQLEQSLVPAVVSSLTGFVRIAQYFGGATFLAVRNDGTLWAWGVNHWGQLGDGTTLTREFPVMVPIATAVSNASASALSSFAVGLDGTFWSWGGNPDGELGLGFFGPTNQQAAAPFPTLNPYISGITNFAIGAWHGLAVGASQAVYTWGSNVEGQLGDGTTTNSAVPSFLIPGPLPILGACGTGVVGGAASGPFDLLTVNGSAGLPARRVDVGLGSPITISVAQPPTNPLASSFALIGYIGVPTPADAYALPFGIGTLCFPAPQLFPSYPGLFTLTNNFGPEPGQLVGSNPAPWSFTAAGLPFAFQFTLQGVIQQDPGTVRVMNGVIVNVQ